MPDVDPDFPRAWVEFTDPAEPGQIVRADLTWLTSRWSCIFGRGCAGLYADRPDDGCCTHGAHFSERADEDRVLAAAAELTAADWQFHGQGLDLVGTDDEGERKTAMHDGACVFLNRPGSAMGAGCALHRLADRTGRSFVTTKPDVCWQLPLRRTYDARAEKDGTDVLVLSLGEYTRAAWGAGGHDFSWYCSANTDAHVGADPVYRSAHDEIEALIGPAAAAVLEELCRQHEEANAWRAARSLPLFAVHPATAAASASQSDR